MAANDIVKGKQPGAAWVQVKGQKNQWTKPPQPTNAPAGSQLTWDDNGGWMIAPQSLSGTGEGVSWAAASKDTYDVSGLIPGAKAPMTGVQVLQDLQAMAYNNDPSWVAIRDKLKNTIPGYSAKDLKLNWTKQDQYAVSELLTNLHNINKGSTQVTPVATFLQNTYDSYKKSGVSYSTINAVSTQPPVVPATSDLADTALTAFQKKLGRAPSQQEANDFSKKFQDLVMSYSAGKKSPATQEMFTSPVQPIQMEGAPAAPVTTSKTGALQQAPTPSTAAEGYAATQNKTEASAKAAVDNLDQFMNMLKG